MISNDDNGSDYSGRPRAADGPGPVDRAATARVATTEAAAAAAAASSAAASSAAKPSDSVRVDSPDDSSRKVTNRPGPRWRERWCEYGGGWILPDGLSDIAEEQVPRNEPPEQQPEEQPENGLNSSQEGIKATDASSKGDSAAGAGAAAAAAGESESSDTATNEPTVVDAPSTGLKRGRVSRKRRKDDEAVVDAEGSRGIKRSNLRSRYPQRPRPSTASAGTGTKTSSGTGGRRQSPKRQQKTKAPTPEDKIRAALSELTGESITAGSQLRCLKRLFSFFRTASSPEKEEFIVSHFVKLRGVEAILSLMKSGSCEVVRYCGEVLLYVCYYDVDITMQLRVHDVMKDALIAYPNNPTLVQVVIGVLQQCADNDFAIDRDIMSGGCLDQAVLAATSHRSMPEIQLNFCLFLQDLTSELKARSDMEHLLRHQPLDCLMQAVKKNFKDDAIALAGLASITNIFQEEVDPRYNRQAFLGLKSTLLKVMKSSRSESVVAQSLALLCSVSRERGGVNELIVESGFIARAKTLMKAFCECAEVQRNGCVLCYWSLSLTSRFRLFGLLINRSAPYDVPLSLFHTHPFIKESILGKCVVDHTLNAHRKHDGDEIVSHCCELQHIQFPLVAKKAPNIVGQS